MMNIAHYVLMFCSFCGCWLVLVVFFIAMYLINNSVWFTRWFDFYTQKKTITYNSDNYLIIVYTSNVSKSDLSFSDTKGQIERLTPLRFLFAWNFIALIAPF